MKMQVIIEAIAVLFASILSLGNNIRQFVRQCRMFYRGLGHVLVCGFAKKELAASEEQPQCTFHESAEGLRPLSADYAGLAVNDDHETAVIINE